MIMYRCLTATPEWLEVGLENFTAWQDIAPLGMHLIDYIHGRTKSVHVSAIMHHPLKPQAPGLWSAEISAAGLGIDVLSDGD